MEIVTINDKYSGLGDVRGCHGVVVDESDNGLSILILKDRENRLTMRLAHHVPRDCVHVHKNSDERELNEYVPTLYDNNLHTTCNDIRQLMEDGRKHRHIKSLYNN